MPELQFKHAITFTSEDPKFTADDFIKGKGKWLCRPDEKASTIKAEFQLYKASIIDFIDIGNSNTFMLTIEVGRSSWSPSQKFVALLPAVMLMSTIDCRKEENSKGVKMFQKGDFNEEVANEKWDQIRITCFNPHRKNSQFGLQFLKIRSNNKEIITSMKENENKEDFVSRMKSSISTPPTNKSLSTNLKIFYKKETVLVPLKPVASLPLSRTTKMITAAKQMPNIDDSVKMKTKMELEALNFLVSLELTPDSIHCLKVSHIREEFELKRRAQLTKCEKIIFKNISLDFAAKKLNENVCDDDVSIISTVASPDEPITITDDVKIVTTTVKNLTPSGRSFSPKRKRNDKLLQDCNITSPSVKRSKVQLAEKASSTSRVWLPRLESKGPKSLMDLPTKRNPKKSLSEPCNFELLIDISDEEDVHEVPQIIHQPQKPTDKAKTTNGELVSLEMVQCPICNERFLSDKIESHAANCTVSFDSDLNPQLTKREIDAVEKCPVCNQSFKLSELQQHAPLCAETSFT